MAFKELGATLMDIPLTYTISAVLLALAAYIAFNQTKAADFPTINEYPGDTLLKKAHAEFMSNARGLVADGLKKFDGPFRVVTTLGSRIILPGSYVDWLRETTDLDHQALVRDEYFSDYPGFEGNDAIHGDPKNTLIGVAKSKLNQTAQCHILHEQMTNALRKIWSDSDDWHPISWPDSSVRFVGRMSSAVFVGPALAENAEWQDLTISYTMNMFSGVRALKKWSPVLRPYIHWFLPEFRTCRSQVRRARALLAPTFAERQKARREAKVEGRKKSSFEDTIEYMAQATKPGARYDPAAAQLGFAMAALHTTTQLFQQSLIDICLNPEIIPALRDEINSAIAENGWTTAGVFKMQLLDSAVKETQRLKPGTIVNLERKALRDVTLPDGKIIPKGTLVAVESGLMWDAEVYQNPEKWDPYRYLNIRKEGKTWAQLVSTSKEHTAFGVGKPICPGRFFAANEVKIGLAHILLEYDVKLVGKKPKILEMGWEMLSDPEVQLEVRRRKHK